jgi:trehalose-6-phosphate synthase
MTIRIRATVALAGVFSFFALAVTAQAQDRPYSEGTVSVVSSIRTEPGQNENYMKYLATTYKQMMDEQKKLGNIVSWSVYTTMPRTADDPNLYLITTYKNLAAMDGLQDKMEAVQAKVIGNQEARDASMAARNKMRTAIGSEVIREVVFR